MENEFQISADLHYQLSIIHFQLKFKHFTFLTNSLRRLNQSR